METKNEPESLSRGTVAATPATPSRRVKPSERTERMHYAIRDVLLVADQASATGKKLVNLNIGDPLLYDFETPPHMIEAIYHAMRTGHNGYAESKGVPEAIEAIREDAHRSGIVNIQEIFIHSGVSEGIDMAVAALVDPGDNVLIPSPGYPLYDTVLAKLGTEAVFYRMDESNGWQPDLDDIASHINNRTRAIVVINPNNPTGAVYSKESLLGILELASRHGLVVFSDEIYSKLLLDPVEFTPIASLAPELPIITFSGLSKAYLAPGFRTGWAIISGNRNDLAGYTEGIARMLRARLCSSNPMQFAIEPALVGDQGHIPRMVEKLRSRRDRMMKIFESFSRIHCVAPQAAFYAFPRLDIPRTDTEFVRDLIMETGVIIVPGSGFDQAPGTRHIRLVFLPPEQLLDQALPRIGHFAETWS